MAGEGLQQDAAVADCCWQGADLLVLACRQAGCTALRSSGRDMEFLPAQVAAIFEALGVGPVRCASVAVDTGIVPEC